MTKYILKLTAGSSETFLPAPVRAAGLTLRRAGASRWGETPSSQVGSGLGHGAAESRPTFAARRVLDCGGRAQRRHRFALHHAMPTVPAAKAPSPLRSAGAVHNPFAASASPRLRGVLALLLLCALCLPWSAAPAQVVSDGATNTLDNVTNAYVGNVTIGTNGSFTGLILTNSGYLTNTGTGVIGLNSGANSNYVFLQGTNTRWHLTGDLTVGNSGAFNRLIVSNGSTVANANGYLGNSSTASNNVALVTGAGSAWNNSGRLLIGNAASFNSLLITNGGTVSNTDGVIGSSASANSNTVTVTGSNSVWNNSAWLFVGYSGIGNQLVLSNGGRVNDNYGWLGYNTGANSNAVTVSGPGSVWNNSGGLYVGNAASFNNLLLTSGGTVSNTDGVIGANTGANSNAVTVTGTNSTWNNSALLLVGGTGSGNQLVVSNGGVVANGNGYLGDFSNASNNAAWVTGSGSLWTNSGALNVGRSGSGNQLVVSNGGVVANGNGFVGYNSTANNNVALVTGTNSLWTNRVDLYFGFSGSGNQLVVSNGGVVANRYGYLGYNSGANNNRVTVTGTNSQWRNSGELVVGYDDNTNNQVAIRAGGLLVSSDGRIGSYSSNANFHTVLVTDAGSTWTNSSFLYVGDTGSGNQLVVSNGGTVVASNIFVGFNSASTDNRVTVDGGNLFATNAGGTAALDIRRGTNVLNAGLIVADNLLLTNSAGFFTFNGGTLNVGTVTVSNGAPFTVGNGTSPATYRMSGAASNVHSFANNLVIVSNATLTGNGTLTGTVTNYGTVSAGNSTGSIRISGDLRLKSSSMMSFDIGGLIATNDYDVVNVTNFVQFAGTLSLSLLNNFLPAPTNSFTLVSFGSSSGSFANVTGGRVSLTNNLASFAVTQTATNLVIGSVTYVDSDGDGQGDLQEQAAGTDPNDPNSYLQVTSVARNGSGYLVVQFQSVPGKSYRIEWKDSAAAAAWNSILAPSLTTPFPGTSEWIDTLTGGLSVATRVYRIGLQ